MEINAIKESKLVFTSVNDTLIYAVSTFAGSAEGYSDGTGSLAQFNCPIGVCVDAGGNIIVADCGNHKIRRIMSDGTTQTIAGTQQGYRDGPNGEAMFSLPLRVCVDAHDNIIVSDFLNHKIRKINRTGMTTTLAGGEQGCFDGIGTDAKFNRPAGVCIDNEGNIVVADYFNHKIRRITPTGFVSTVAGSIKGFGDGPGNEAKFNCPHDVCVEKNGSIIVADCYNHRIRKITVNSLTGIATVATIAGGTQGEKDGIGLEAQFNGPYGVTVDTIGNIIVTDSDNHKIRKITPSGVVSTLAGSSSEGFLDDAGPESQFNYPRGVCVDRKGNIIVADGFNHKIRKITPNHGHNPYLYTLLNRLMRNRKYSDMTVYCQGTPFYLHQAIVRTRCPELFVQSDASAMATTTNTNATTGAVNPNSRPHSPHGSNNEVERDNSKSNSDVVATTSTDALMDGSNNSNYKNKSSSTEKIGRTSTEKMRTLSNASTNRPQSLTSDSLEAQSMPNQNTSNNKPRSGSGSPNNSTTHVLGVAREVSNNANASSASLSISSHSGFEHVPTSSSASSSISAPNSNPHVFANITSHVTTTTASSNNQFGKDSLTGSMTSLGTSSSNMNNAINSNIHELFPSLRSNPLYVDKLKTSSSPNWDATASALAGDRTTRLERPNSVSSPNSASNHVLNGVGDKARSHSLPSTTQLPTVNALAQQQHSLNNSSSNNSSASGGVPVSSVNSPSPNVPTTVARISRQSRSHTANAQLTGYGFSSASNSNSLSSTKESLVSPAFESNASSSDSTATSAHQLRRNSSKDSRDAKLENADYRSELVARHDQQLIDAENVEGERLARCERENNNSSIEIATAASSISTPNSSNSAPVSTCNSGAVKSKSPRHSRSTSPNKSSSGKLVTSTSGTKLSQSGTTSSTSANMPSTSVVVSSSGSTGRRSGAKRGLPVQERMQHSKSLERLTTLLQRDGRDDGDPIDEQKEREKARQSIAPHHAQPVVVATIERPDEKEQQRDQRTRRISRGSSHPSSLSYLDLHLDNLFTYYQDHLEQPRNGDSSPYDLSGSLIQGNRSSQPGSYFPSHFLPNMPGPDGFFQACSSERHMSITFNVLQPHQFKLLIAFLYLNHLQCTNVIDLLYLRKVCTLLRLSELAKQCQYLLVANISPHNAFSFLATCAILELKEEANWCVWFIRANHIALNAKATALLAPFPHLIEELNSVKEISQKPPHSNLNEVQGTDTIKEGKTKHLPLSNETSERKVRYEEDAFVRNITNNYFEEKKEKKNALESMMEQLFTSYPYADFEISLKNQDYSICVHSCILGTRWAFFDAILSKAKPVKDDKSRGAKDSIVGSSMLPLRVATHETPMPKECFRKMIYYFYTGTRDFSLREVGWILCFCEYYMLDDELKALCSYLLNAHIKPENWADVMSLGLEINNDELVTRAIEVIPSQVNSSEIVRLVLGLIRGCEKRIGSLERDQSMLQSAIEKNLGNEIESRIINQIVEKLVIEKAQKLVSERDESFTENFHQMNDRIGQIEKRMLEKERLLEERLQRLEELERAQLDSGAPKPKEKSSPTHVSTVSHSAQTYGENSSKSSEGGVMKKKKSSSTSRKKSEQSADKEHKEKDKEKEKERK